jgi:hypothetical protein
MKPSSDSAENRAEQERGVDFDLYDTEARIVDGDDRMTRKQRVGTFTFTFAVAVVVAGTVDIAPAMIVGVAVAFAVAVALAIVARAEAARDADAYRVAQRADLIAALEAAPPSDQEREK